MNKFEFKKWGNGSSTYTVSMLVDYNPITKRGLYEVIGDVYKRDAIWTGDFKGKYFRGATRQEVVDKLVLRHREVFK